MPFGQPFLPDGSEYILVSQQSRTLTCYSTTDGSSLRTADINVDCVAHSPDQRELVTYDGVTINVLNLADLSVARSQIFDSPSDYSNLIFAPDGRHFVIGTRSRLALFTWPTLEKRWELELPAHFVTFNSEGDQIWAAEHGSARARRIAAETGTQLNDLTVGDGTGWAFWAAHPARGTIAVLSGFQALKITRIDTATAEVATRDDGHTREIHCIAVSPDGFTAATGGFDKTVRLWDLETGSEKHCLRAFDDLVYHLRFSPDGQYLAGTDVQGKVVVWDREGKEKCRIPTFVGQAKVDFAREGDTLIVPQQQGGLAFYDAERGLLRRSVSVAGGKKHSMVETSPNGDLLALAGDGAGIHILDPKTLSVWREFPGVGGRTYQIQFSQNSRYLFGSIEANGAPIRRWNLETGEILDFPGFAAVEGLAFQPGGGILALGQSSYSGRIALSNGLTPSFPYQAMAGDQHQLGSRLAFTPDGRHLLAGGNAGIVHILRIPNQPQTASTWLEHKRKITND
jgi:WD40 repeat protein